MALERFIPKSPDMFIRNSQDFEVAKFGHLNTIVEYINNNSAKPAGLNGYVQFNDNAALGGDAGLFWDNVNKRLGVGTVTPLAPLNVYNSSASVSNLLLLEQDTSATIGQIINYRKNGSVNLTSGAEIGRLSFGGYFNSTYSPPSQTCSAIYGYYGGTGTDRVGGLRLVTWNGGGLTTRLQVAPDGKIGIGTTIATAKLEILGEGSTSATTALRVQNSSGTAALTVRDDLTSVFGSNVSISPTSGGSIQLGVDPNVMFRISDGSGYQKFNIIRGSGGGMVGIYGGSQGGNQYVSGDTGHSFSFPSSNNNPDTATITRAFRGNINLSTINLLNITSTNEIALSNATLLRGLYINPTVTDWVSVRAIETTGGNVIFNGGNVGIGTSSPTKKLDVVGAAADGIIRVAGPYSDIQLINKNSAYNVGDWKPAIRFLENGVFTADIAYAGGFFEFGSGLKASTIYTTGSSNSLGITNSDVTVDIGGRSQLITFTDYNYGLIRGGINLPYVASPSGYGMNIYVNSGAMTFTTGGSTRLSIAQAGGVTITGGGSTSATTSLLVQNSSGTQLGAVNDAGQWMIGTGTPAFQLDATNDIRARGSLYWGTAGSYLYGDINNVRLYDKNNSIILQAHPNGVANSETYLQSSSGGKLLRINDNAISLEWANFALGSTTQNPIKVIRGFFGNVGATDKTVLNITTPFFSNLSNATTLRGIFIDINDTTTYTGFTTVRAIEAPRGGAYFNTTTPEASAILQADSTTQGFLPPRMTNAQRGLITTPSIGLMVYCTDSVEGLYVYKSTGWTFVA